MTYQEWTLFGVLAFVAVAWWFLGRLIKRHPDGVPLQRDEED